MERKRDRIQYMTCLLLLALLIAVNGCRSSKTTTVPGGMTLKEIKNLPPVKSQTEYLSAKVRLNANLKGKEFSANGSIKIKRGEGILISINALGGIIEVARIEITPEEALFVYRLGRKYARLRYSEIEAFNNLGLDYRMLESILLNEIFSPDGALAEKAVDKMDITSSNGELVLSAAGKKIDYKFYIRPSEGNLVLTQGKYARSISVDCNYSDFVESETRPRPSRLHFSAGNISLRLQMSNIKESPFKLSRTTDTSSYEKIDLSRLLNNLNQ